MQRWILRYATVLMVIGLSLAACRGDDDRTPGDRAAVDTARQGGQAEGTRSGDRTGRGDDVANGGRETRTAERTAARERAGTTTRERTGTLGAGTPAPLPEKKDVRMFRLGAGTPVELRNMTEINSRNNKVGDPVTASAARAVYSARGDTVIPAGAEFVGHVDALAPAERPGAEGRMVLTFDSVRLNGRTLPIRTRIVSMGSITKGRGVTAGDAAKVGAGAVIGGAAGRVIGGDRRGTIIGAATGAAAGAVIAHNTRDIDIVLPVGATVQLELSRSFDATPAHVTSRR